MREMIQDAPLVKERKVGRYGEKKLKEEEEKRPAAGGIRTHNLQITRHVLSEFKE